MICDLEFVSNFEFRISDFGFRLNMSLKTKLQDDLKRGMKAKDELIVSVLRLVLAAVLNKEKEKRYKLTKEKPDLKEEDLAKESELNDEEVNEVISSESKKRQEAIIEYEKGKRQDLAEKERKEAAILKKYLPEQIPEEEIKKLVKAAIEKVGAKEPRDIGKVMAELMPKVKGKADGSLVSKIVREILFLK